MNTETDNQTASQSIFDEERSFRAYRPRLSFYHANAKGSGSAARFELVPAAGDRDGVIYLTLAQQKSVASAAGAEGRAQFATFDWQNRVTVKLNFSDICQMLLVFRGVADAVADGKGLYHSSGSMTTIINLTRQSEPYAGLALEVSRRSKSEPDAAVRVRIVFREAEAFGVGAVLEQSLGLIAFGVQKEAALQPTAPRNEAEPL
jgi:hypothetical protein